MAQAGKSNSFFGWLGRQVGYVKKAVQTDVTKTPKVVYRQRQVEEAPHPVDPNVTLRRTTIDEAIQPRGSKCDK